MIELGLAENIQRQDLDPLEEAQMFETLIAQRGYSQRSLAARIGKDKGYIEIDSPSCGRPPMCSRW